VHRRMPVSELALLVSVAMGGFAMFNLQTPRGKWAMAGAVVIGLLASLEISWRERRRRRSITRGRR
jgi:hypothetical protein